MTRTVSDDDDKSPNNNESANPWKIGSDMMKALPIMAAAAVSTVGRKRIARPPAAPRATAGRGPPLADEIDEQDRAAHDDAGQCDKAAGAGA
jgi:hypothetical protein